MNTKGSCVFCRNHEAWWHDAYDVDECSCNAGVMTASEYHLGNCYPQLFSAKSPDEMCPYYQH